MGTLSSFLLYFLIIVLFVLSYLFHSFPILINNFSGSDLYILSSFLLFSSIASQGSVFSFFHFIYSPFFWSLTCFLLCHLFVFNQLLLSCPSSQCFSFFTISNTPPPPFPFHPLIFLNIHLVTLVLFISNLFFILLHFAQSSSSSPLPYLISLTLSAMPFHTQTHNLFVPFFLTSLSF